MLDKNKILTTLINTSDITYGKYLFMFELLKDKINDFDKDTIIKEAIFCGQEEANKILVRYPNQSITKIINSYNIKINLKDNYQDSYDRYLFGFFEYPNRINVVLKSCEAVISNLENYDIIFKDLFTKDKIIDLVLAHEFFHYLENSNKKIIYTKTKKISTFKFLGINMRSNITALSEIAAMSFAKTLASSLFNPVILDYLLLDYKQPKDAIKIYKTISIGYMKN